ncbi:hypothetical protein [Brachybacterium hainanense]|uniref:Uncharacterized protein n=1 Tax=Brachybacterium hainanense TaxID=1541174 RepID=A0ABV6REZ5_9MICO
MSTMTHASSRSDRSRRAPREGRPATFVSIVAFAGLIVLWVLLTGPTMPLPLALGAAGAVLALLGAAWHLAGPDRSRG